jgi:hypothetical protein
MRLIIIIKVLFLAPVADYHDVRHMRNMNVKFHAFQISGLNGGALLAALPGFFTSRDKKKKGPVRKYRRLLGTHCRRGDGNEKSVRNGIPVAKPAANHFTL